MERIEMTKADRLVHAKTMSAFAKENLAEGLECWKGEDDMIAMTRGDSKDYREIAKLLRHDSAEAALKLLQSLDTAARDCVPDSVWDALQSDDDYKRYTKGDERDVVVYRIRRYTDEIEALQAKLKAANEQLMRIDL